MTDDRYSALSTGLLMMAAGVVLALHNLGRFDAWVLRPWWPLLLLVPAGQALFGDKGCGRGWTGALIWTLASMALLAHTHGYPVLRPGTVLAAACVLGGAYLLWRTPRDGAPRQGRAS